MAAYLVTEKIIIKRQEGDFPATIDLIVPESIDMSLYTEVKFGVYNSSGTELFLKTLSGGAITVDLQTIHVNLVASDTLGREGKHQWECEISKEDGVITIAEGYFLIKKQLIPNT